MHVAQIDLRAPGIRFKVSPPGGDREVIRQSTLDFLIQERAQIAINAHYFLPFPSEDKTAWVIGLGASEGRVFSAFEAPEQSYALVAFAPAINIDRDNHASIVNYDPAYSDRLHVREKVTLWNVVAGSSQIVTGGARQRAGVSRRQPFRRRARSGRARQLLERQGVGRRHDGKNGNRLIAGSADADAVHGGCAPPFARALRGRQ